jgi:S1-C subfamily serine protease
MKKLLSILVLGLLFFTNSNSATFNYQNYTIQKKDNANTVFNRMANDWNDFVKKIAQDNSCNSIAVTDTPFTDLMDCIHRGIEKHLRRYNIATSSGIVSAFYDYYEDGFYRAKNIQIKIIREGTGDMRDDVNRWSRYIDDNLEDTVKYSRNIWLQLAERASASSDGKSKDNSKKVAQSGSGFFINNKGYFITNNHVVDGCTQSKITFKEESIDAELIATDQNLDLALLRAKIKPKGFLNLSDDPPEKLQKIYVAGYPFGKGLSDDLKFTQGIISAVKGYADNSNQIQIDAAINSGNSGGPIVDEDGSLIAVAVSGLDKSASEGIGFGIKASSLRNFLDVNDIDYSTPGILNFGMNANKLNNLLEKSTVYTFCN